MFGLVSLYLSTTNGDSFFETLSQDNPSVGAFALVYSLTIYLISLMYSKMEERQLFIEDSVNKERALFAEGPVAVVIWNMDNGFSIRYASENTLEVLGYSQQELLGMDFADLIHPDDISRIAGEVKGFLDAGAKTWDQLYRIIDKEGNEIFLQDHTVAETHPKTQKLNGLRGYLIDITETEKYKNKIEKLAAFDILTSLPNRTTLEELMIERMADALDSQTLLAACYLDIDDFKTINDLYGKDVGDAALIKVSKKLTNALDHCIISRPGGDEFIVMLYDMKTQDEVVLNVRKILDTINTPLHVDKQVMKLTASAGVSIYPLDNSDSDTLVRHADVAMYEAKLKGKNQFVIFDEKKKHAKASKHELIERLLQALKKDEMELYYQPKIEIKSNRVTGFEALIRWNHPEKGVLSPDKFLPNLHGHSSMVELDLWVIQKAFKQLSQWNRQGYNFVVAVNITNESILNSRFVENVCDTISLNPDVRPEQIHFEILETSFLKDMNLAKSQIKQIRALGIKISLDDFGTGYSSLGYLRNLPADYIKIDQTFVQGLLDDDADLAIVKGVVQLSKVFRLKAVAEGVENKNVLHKLHSLGCEYAQGYYISKPMPQQEVIKWLEESEYISVYNAISA